MYVKVCVAYRQAIVYEFNRPYWRNIRDLKDDDYIFVNVLRMIGKSNVFVTLRIENKKRTIDELQKDIGKQLRIKPENIVFQNTGGPLAPFNYLIQIGALDFKEVHGE